MAWGSHETSLDFPRRKRSDKKPSILTSTTVFWVVTRPKKTIYHTIAQNNQEPQIPPDSNTLCENYRNEKIDNSFMHKCQDAWLIDSTQT